MSDGDDPDGGGPTGDTDPGSRPAESPAPAAAESAGDSTAESSTGPTRDAGGGRTNLPDASGGVEGSETTSSGAVDRPGPSGLRRFAPSALAPRLGMDVRAVWAVLALTTVGTAARLVALGDRVAHFDEGRVAYWALRYAETGQFQYRYIVHGPLVQHADRWLFALAGPGDAAMRLPVALVGGLLPAAALLYRDHLRDGEVVGVAAVLALNPLLVYYSRFLRSDLLVAAFMLAALGALLRLWATRRPGYLHAAAALGALGHASKENAVLYVLCWLGAAAIAADTGLHRPRRAATGLGRLRSRLASVRASVAGEPARVRSLVARWTGHGLGATALFAVLTLLLFAPRAGGTGGPDLWRVLGDPGHLPAVVRATARDLGAGYGYWFGGAAEPGCREETLPAGYACFLGRMGRTLGWYALPAVVLGAAGFLRERYAAARSRPLVMAAGYWAAASALGYPLGTDIWAAWVAVHVVVPLSIPAGVGVGWLLGTAGGALAADRRPALALSAGALVVLAGVQGAVAAEAAYLNHSGRDSPSDVVQYAQPGPELRPAVGAMAAAVAGHDGGPDVVYYGDRFFLEDESAFDRPPPRDPINDTGGWYARLPLPWYTASADAEVASVERTRTLDEAMTDRPPVVIADVGQAATVAERAENYRRFEFDLRAPLDRSRSVTPVVVFVDARRLPGS